MWQHLVYAGNAFSLVTGSFGKLFSMRTGGMCQQSSRQVHVSHSTHTSVSWEYRHRHEDESSPDSVGTFLPKCSCVAAGTTISVLCYMQDVCFDFSMKGSHIWSGCKLELYLDKSEFRCFWLCSLHSHHTCISSTQELVRPDAFGSMTSSAQWCLTRRALRGREACDKLDF